PDGRGGARPLQAGRTPALPRSAGPPSPASHRPTPGRTPAGPRADTSPRRILIIKPSSLGDIVHALPVLALLRETWPQAHIAWLVGTAFAPLLDGHPLLDEVIVFDRRRFGRLLQSRRILTDFGRFIWQLR